ncbi:hypothetical protein BOO71_0006274 [Deinococcus marmoris]|uniref:Uncharacterized protein n=1 Tax=Deinococcus marmoris TaxID=249408 RepID=A0A1U7NZQ0_9DEIO|nr:hypothetical protein BOO71_0006274 [Deinococcus marmoris]
MTPEQQRKEEGGNTHRGSMPAASDPNLCGLSPQPFMNTTVRAV